jgi:predicted nucleotidyltransferase
VFEEIAGLMRKTAGLAEVLRAALAPLADQLQVAFIYGSMAAGSAGASSDVDVMAIGDAGFAALVKELHPTQATLRREVNPTVMTAAEFAKRRREDDLAEPRKNRAAQGT